jgi:hypothetical protein
VKSDVNHLELKSARRIAVRGRNGAGTDSGGTRGVSIPWAFVQQGHRFSLSRSLRANINERILCNKTKSQKYHRWRCWIIEQYLVFVLVGIFYIIIK